MAGSSLSVIVPAHNEAENLPATLACLHEGLATAGREYEIVVVDNASTDATADVARAHGARVVHEPHRQISRTRNTGARQTGGAYLLFVDADTWPAPALLREALERLDAGACGGGALVAFDRSPNRLYQDGLRFWNTASARFSFAAGCFLFTRRDAFEAVGGFDEHLYAGDEVTLSRRLRRWGRPRNRDFGIIRSPAVRTSGRKAEWFTAGQHVMTLGLALFLPFALRSRRLMWFWYTRPNR